VATRLLFRPRPGAFVSRTQFALPERAGPAAPAYPPGGGAGVWGVGGGLAEFFPKDTSPPGLLSIWCPVCKVPYRILGTSKTIKTPSDRLQGSHSRPSTGQYKGLTETAVKNSAYRSGVKLFILNNLAGYFGIGVLVLRTEF